MQGKAFHREEKVDWRKRTSVERNWMRRGEKLQKDLREGEKLSCEPKEAQDSLKNDLQQRLQEVEQRRHDLLPETGGSEKITKDKKHPGQKKKDAKKRKCCSTRGDAEEIAMRSDFGSCWIKSTRTKWLMQKSQQNFRGCWQEKKEEAAMLRKRWIVVWRRWWNTSSLWEQIRRGLSSLLCARCSSRNSKLIRFLRKCQEKEEKME